MGDSGQHQRPFACRNFYAFDAGNLNELWNSDQNSADKLGTFAKFVSPTVANGRVYVATFSNSVGVYGLLPAGMPAAQPTITAVTNTASQAQHSAIAPGEAVTIHGANLGPDAAATMQLDLSGAVSLTLADTMALFNGIPAPVTYAGAGQVSAVAPFELPVGTATVAGAPSGS